MSVLFHPWCPLPGGVRSCGCAIGFLIPLLGAIAPGAAGEEAKEREKEATPPWVFERSFAGPGPAGREAAEEAETEGEDQEQEEDKNEEDEPGKDKDGEESRQSEELKVSLPSGFQAVEGVWGAKEGGGPLLLLPEPLVEGRVEFGTEQRETAAAIVARASGELRRPLAPRMGVGLYGVNGYQLRLAGETGRVELVRRGEVLADAPCGWEAGEEFLFELVVEAEEEDWIVTGRVWRAGETRPGEPMVRVKAWSDELLFPLAGRPALVATAFSGAPVRFHKVKVSGPGYDPAWLEGMGEGE